MAEERDTPRIHEYWLEKRRVQETVDGPETERLALVLTGDYFHVGEALISVLVGDVPAIPLEMDGPAMVCLLYTQPSEGAEIVVRQGDQRMVAPEPFTMKRLRRRRPKGGR